MSSEPMAAAQRESDVGPGQLGLALESGFAGGVTAAEPAWAPASAPRAAAAVQVIDLTASELGQDRRLLTLNTRLQEICEALEAPVPFRRGSKNDQREAGELFAGLRRELKQSSKPLLRELEPLLNDLEADLAATLNVESHASRGRASSAEVWAALGRVHQLDRRWSCTQCGTRVWYQRTPRAWLCRCGRTHFPPLAEEPQSH